MARVHDKIIPSCCEIGVTRVPEGLEAVSGIEAAQRHDSAGTFFGPKHA